MGEPAESRDGERADPPYLYPAYVATRLRAPSRPLVTLPLTASEASGPVYGESAVTETDHDLTRFGEHEPLGQRIVVGGRVLEEGGRPTSTSRSSAAPSRSGS